MSDIQFSMAALAIVAIVAIRLGLRVGVRGPGVELSADQHKDPPKEGKTGV